MVVDLPQNCSGLKMSTATIFWWNPDVNRTSSRSTTGIPFLLNFGLNDSIMSVQSTGLKKDWDMKGRTSPTCQYLHGINHQLEAATLTKCDRKWLFWEKGDYPWGPSQFTDYKNILPLRTSNCWVVWVAGSCFLTADTCQDFFSFSFCFAVRDVPLGDPSSHGVPAVSNSVKTMTAALLDLLN